MFRNMWVLPIVTCQLARPNLTSFGLSELVMLFDLESPDLFTGGGFVSNLGHGMVYSLSRGG